MRPDQIARLNDLSEKLADRFLMDADPAEWPGGSFSLTDLTKQERGDAYWCKKNAMATGGVLRYALDLLKSHSAQGGGEPEDIAKDADIEKKIKEAERRAAVAVSRVLDKAKKRTFDEKVNGK